jgi:hypothetical protein
MKEMVENGRKYSETLRYSSKCSFSFKSVFGMVMIW